MTYTTSQLTAIEQRLDNLLGDSNLNLGLYNGKTGAAFAYFALSGLLNKDNNMSKGQQLLSEVCNHLGQVDSAGFSDGLAGIGWGIESMSQNGFIPINPDTVLKDFDDFIYKSVAFQKSASLSLDDGSLGRALYFYQRLKSTKSNLHPYQMVAHQECLILLTDEIREYLADEEKGLVRENACFDSLGEKQIRDIAQSFMLLYHLYRIRINKESCLQMLCKLKSFTERYFRDKAVLAVHDFWLLHNYTYLANVSEDEQMTSHARQWFERYHPKVELSGLSFLYQILFQKWCRMWGYTVTPDINMGQTSLFEILLLAENEQLLTPWLRGLLLI